MYRFRHVMFAAGVSALALTMPGHTAEIRLGMITSQTGPYAFSGVPIRNGIKLAIDQANAAANDGDTFSLVDTDSGGDKAQAITLTSRLAQTDQVLMILGPTNSVEAAAAAPVANELKVPFLATGSSDAIINAGPYTFKMLAGASDVMGHLSTYAVDTLKIKKASFVYDRTNDAFHSQMTTFKDLLVASGVEVASEEGILPSDSDFLALATKLASQDIDAFFVAAPAEVSANVLRQARQAGVLEKTVFLGPAALASSNFIDTAGSAANGAVIVADYFPGDPLESNQKFVESYQAAYGQIPDSWAAMGYALAGLSIEAVKRSGSSPDREKITAELAGLKDVPTIIGNHSYSFGPNRHPQYGAVLITVEDGKFALVD